MYKFLIPVNSTTSSVSSTKYDPDLLRSDVALARNRVARLKRELEQINMEMQYKQQGVDRLTRFAHLYFCLKIFRLSMKVGAHNPWACGKQLQVAWIKCKGSFINVSAKATSIPDGFRDNPF